ncbi:hypothetical protein BCON_0080g00110 [Botryotinia convoluta]|uniref:Uncharacterized protein n=1 Tax=Botryotinia convoluta TaxID=54673 RepID=A0A4Z1I6D7_9HELO|nr:hypothetical protein BCON_0080g00110 [Botryotinia convoluta]
MFLRGVWEDQGGENFVGGRVGAGRDVNDDLDGSERENICRTYLEDEVEEDGFEGLTLYADENEDDGVDEYEDEIDDFAMVYLIV